MRRTDPLRNFRFRLEIDGINEASFSEVAIGETTSDVIDYRDGTDPSHVRKLSGLTKYGNITLKWGVTDSTLLEEWQDAIVNGQIQTNRKTVTIVVIDEANNDRARFLVSEAWPSKYQVSGLNAKGNEVLVETLELVNEGVDRVR